MPRPAAKREDWKTEPLPSARVELDVPAHSFTDNERERLVLGLVPEVMEDRWFVYAEGDRLHFHRSWTGFGIYEASLEQRGAGWQLTDAWASRETEQYSGKDAAWDAEQLLELCKMVLFSTRGQ